MKKTLLIPTTLLAILALASCGAKTSTPSESTGTPDTGATTGTDTGTDTNPGTDTDTTPEPLTEDQMAAKLVADFDAAIANRGSVKSATFDHGMDYGEAQPYSPVSETLEFGSNNSLHYTETAWGTITDHYVYKDASGDIYAYNVDADGRVLPDPVYEEDGDNVLKGVNVTNFGFYNPMGLGVYFYSFEEIAKLSAAAALANACGERGITMPTENSYDVSFNASYDDEWGGKYYYSVSLQAEFDPTTKALTKLSTQTWNYTPEQVELSADGSFEIIEEAYYSSIVNYEATVGAREALDLLNVADFYYTSFGLSHDGAAVAENSTVEVDYEFGSWEPIAFAFTNVLPATASSRFDNVAVKVTEKDSGFETYDVSGYVNASSGELELTANAGGTFNVTLETKNFSFSFNLKVNMSLPTPTELTIWEVLYVENTENPDWSYHYTDTPAESYDLDTTVGFSVTADPYGADGSVTMTLTCNGEAAAISPASYVEYGTTYNYFEATLSKAGTYVLTATSTVAPEVTSSVTFTVA